MSTLPLGIGLLRFRCHAPDSGGLAVLAVFRRQESRGRDSLGRICHCHQKVFDFGLPL